MRRLILDYALLPDGWVRQVGLDIENGVIRAVQAGAAPEGRGGIPGIAFPGLPNLPAPPFPPAMSVLS